MTIYCAPTADEVHQVMTEQFERSMLSVRERDRQNRWGKLLWAICFVVVVALFALSSMLAWRPWALSPGAVLSIALFAPAGMLISALNMLLRYRTMSGTSEAGDKTPLRPSPPGTLPIHLIFAATGGIAV